MIHNVITTIAMVALYETGSRKVEPVPGVQIFRFEAPLYFANAEQFRDRLYDRTSLNPKKLKGKKQKALYNALMQRKREMELQEAEERSARRKSKKYKKPDPPQRSSIEEQEEMPEELTEQQESLLAKEKKEILKRFSKAWIPPIHTLIIDLSVVSYVDTVSLKILTQVCRNKIAKKLTHVLCPNILNR
ncbi:hypothetical protein KUTeg_021223 [Tegillarca granosa]|uniref:STAS domain-containing protein n=1 Tax=Tegillarca granosa TaxID=220873 RepID=A0ABQ9ECV0_TEGGR|nr:hypothetical protein KUTeg_021223 [Tegillarca granosa]